MRKFTEFSTQMMIIVLLGLVAIQIGIILEAYFFALMMGIMVALASVGAMMYYMHRLRQ